jgi:hypothetical protein
MAKQENKQETRKKSVKRRLLIWLGVGVAVVLLLIGLLPAFLSSNAGTSFLLAQLNRSMGGTLTVDDLSLGWFGGVQVQNLSWQDESGDMQVQIASLKARPKLLALLAGRIALTDAVVERPNVQMKVPTVPSSAPSSPVEKTETAKSGSVYRIGPIELEVRQGQAVLEQACLNGQPPMRLEVRNLASTVVLNASGKDSAVSVSMNVGDGRQEGTVEAKGEGIALSLPAGLAGLSGRFEVQIDSLSLASLVPVLALAGTDVKMSGTLNSKANVEITNGQIENLQVSADLERFEQVLGEQTLRLEQPVKARAHISAKNGDWLIEELGLESSFCRLEGKGGLNTLEYTLSADLAQTQAFASSLADFQGYQAGGILSANGKIQYQQQSVKASGRIGIQELTLRQGPKSLALSELNQNYEMTVLTDASTLQIHQFELAAPPAGNLTIADGMLKWDKPDIEAAFQVAAMVDLKNTRPILDFFSALPEDVSIAGVVRPQAKIEMKEGTVRIVTTSTEAENLTISKPAAEPFVCPKITVKADAVWDLKKNALRQLKGFELDSEPIKIRGDLEQSASDGGTRISGQAEADYDWKEVTALARPFLPEGLTLEGKRKDRFEFLLRKPEDASAGGLEILKAGGSFGFAKAAYKGFSAGPAELTLKTQQGLLAIDLADTPLNEGTLRLAGDIDLKSEPMVFRLRKPMAVIEKVRINDELSRNLLEYVNPIFAGASQVSGSADFSCEELVVPLAMERKDLLKMKAVLAINQLTMRSEGFLKELLNAIGSDPSAVLTLQPTPVVLENEVLSYENMKLDVGKKPIVFSGRIGLDRRLQLEMQLPWTLSGQTIRTGEEAVDRIVLAVGGTIQKPQVDWGKMLKANLGRALLKELIK